MFSYDTFYFKTIENMKVNWFGISRSLRSLVRYRVENSKIKFISTRGHVIFSMSSTVLGLVLSFRERKNYNIIRFSFPKKKHNFIVFTNF